MNELGGRGSLPEAMCESRNEPNTYAFSVPEVCDRTKPAVKADTKTIAIGVAETQGWVLGFCEAMKIDKHEILFKQDTS